MKQHIAKVPFTSQLSKEEFDNRVKELLCLLALETKRLHDKKKQEANVPVPTAQSSLAQIIMNLLRKILLSQADAHKPHLDNIKPAASRDGFNLGD